MIQEINNECWRTISGYLKYQVSNVGRVRHAKTGRILKQCCWVVVISKCVCVKKYIFQYIHNLVFNGFL